MESEVSPIFGALQETSAMTAVLLLAGPKEFRGTRRSKDEHEKIETQPELRLLNEG